MTDTTQQYTSGTLDNLNVYWYTFAFNMEGAQTTLEPATRWLKSITFAGATSSSSSPTYMHVWEIVDGVLTHKGCSKEPVAAYANVDTTWEFKAVKIDTSKEILFTFSTSTAASTSGLSRTRSRVYHLSTDTTHVIGRYNYYPSSNGFAYMPVATYTFTDAPSTGTVHIEKGYYNTGTYEIFSGDMTKTLYDLKVGQTIGCKNSLFMTGKNNVSTPYITSLAAPTGSFGGYVNLNHPIYLNYTKNFIVGDTPKTTMIEYTDGAYTANYSAVGSPTISSEYVASGFSESNYIPIGMLIFLMIV